MRRIRFYAALLIGVALILFVLQNLHSTEIRVLLWRLQMPLVVVVLGSVVTGAVWAALWIGLVRWRKCPEQPHGDPSKKAT